MASFLASSQASIGAAAASLVTSRINRRHLVIRNTHATQSLFIGPDNTVTTANGFLVPAANGVIELFGYTGAVFAIGSGAATTATILELYD